ncbi:PE-PGRS family protein PE_PGRS26-like [Polistes fuscatus]|uniref:PE-PGRS family protein PE_PGRS26-like n=1 Tax=Polistes fuscatus TaxID=30207 RepID=UPI001CA7BB46|nr:PE-PGRS family protein PE_PGRS26-like [Polistes fuscatus]
MGWFVLAGILIISICATGLPLPQGGGGLGAHGQPQAGLSGTSGPNVVGGAGGVGISAVAGGAVVGVSGTGGGAGGGAVRGSSGVGGVNLPSSGSSSSSGGSATVVGSSGIGTGIGSGVTGGSIGGGAGGGAAGGGSGLGSSSGPSRRGRQGWRFWRRGDPTLMNLWKSQGPLGSLGNAKGYIILALLIGVISMVIGCWLSDNCWSPEPEGVVTLA